MQETWKSEFKEIFTRGSNLLLKLKDLQLSIHLKTKEARDRILALTTSTREQMLILDDKLKRISNDPEIQVDRALTRASNFKNQLEAKIKEYEMAEEQISKWMNYKFDKFENENSFSVEEEFQFSLLKVETDLIQIQQFKSIEGTRFYLVNDEIRSYICELEQLKLNILHSFEKKFCCIVAHDDRLIIENMVVNNCFQQLQILLNEKVNSILLIYNDLYLILGLIKYELAFFEFDNIKNCYVQLRRFKLENPERVYEYSGFINGLQVIEQRPDCIMVYLETSLRFFEWSPKKTLRKIQTCKGVASKKILKVEQICDQIIVLSKGQVTIVDYLNFEIEKSFMLTQFTNEISLIPNFDFNIFPFAIFVNDGKWKAIHLKSGKLIEKLTGLEHFTMPFQSLEDMNVTGLNSQKNFELCIAKRALNLN